MAKKVARTRKVAPKGGAKAPKGGAKAAAAGTKS